MRIRPVIVLGAACMVVGGASYFAGRGAAQAQGYGPMGRWLNLTAAQEGEVQKDDPTFSSDVQRLSAAARDERQKLADLLADSGNSEAVLKGQLQRALEADGALQNRVLAYVLKVRDHLTAAQQQQLMALCAQGFGGGMGQGRGMGRGRGAGMGLQGGIGRGQGGPGRGLGPGRGMGRGPWWQDQAGSATSVPATGPQAQ